MAGAGGAGGAGGGGAEWFAAAGGPEGGRGLRFECTRCGNCCTGPPGVVMVSDQEARAIAARLGLSVERFSAAYTRAARGGRSLSEVESAAGFDCVFLRREAGSGRALCAIYEDRPGQCRTWPFWPSVVGTRQAWESAGRRCPGMGRGQLVPVERVRVLRDAVEI
ncbi:MAG: hypothetical protein C0475_02185 [Planctomyces sp.]|nr:hypothetical protein [Planctomyces sp.]MBA4119829.1 hypothetical protein [Isosphaera sp.]